MSEKEAEAVDVDLSGLDQPPDDHFKVHDPFAGLVAVRVTDYPKLYKRETEE